MAIVRWMPGRPIGQEFMSEFERLRNQMLDLFDSRDTAARGLGLSRTGVFPPLNISEDADNLYVTAELPGITANELNLSVENEKLILRGERKIPEKNRQVNYHRREREAGNFRRVITLPVKIDADKVSAVARDGVLDITLPKTAEAKPREIPISVS